MITANCDYDTPVGMYLMATNHHPTVNFDNASC